MEHYGNPFEGTSKSRLRRSADVLFAAGLGAVLACFVAGATVAGWLIAVVPTAAALGFITVNEFRLNGLNERTWGPEQWDLLREDEYRRRQGVFLTHTATRSVTRRDDGRTVWYVTLRLAQHNQGPLSEGRIKRVEYAFGDKFTEGSPVIVQSPANNFAYSTDMHGPLMMLARVVFENWYKRPLIVERYVDLPEE